MYLKQKKKKTGRNCEIAEPVSQESNRRILELFQKYLLKVIRKKVQRTGWVGIIKIKWSFFQRKIICIEKGDYAIVKIESCTGATLIGQMYLM